MAERSTGVLVGGILALIGALIGIWGWLALTALSAAASMNIVYAVIDPILYFVMGAVTPAVGALFPWLVLLGSILAIIFSILLIAGKMMKISALLLLIAGILSILVIMAGIWMWVLPGILELLGAIIALATGAW